MNLKSLIQSSEILSVELTGTIHNYTTVKLIVPLIYFIYIYILKIEKQNIKGKSRLQKKELRERKKLMDTLKNKASWRAGGQHPKSKEPTRLQVKDQDAEEWAAVFTSLGTQLKG